MDKLNLVMLRNSMVWLNAIHFECVIYKIRMSQMMQIKYDI